jgi:DHA1 family inner membrane transport protein
MQPPDPPASRRAPPGSWVVRAPTAAVFTSSTFWLALSPFLPSLARDLDTSLALLGQVPALLTLLAALLGPVVGPIADRTGYRRVLLVGLLGVALASLATALAPAYPLLLVAALFGALGRAAVLPVAQAAAASHVAEGACWQAVCRVTAGISLAAIIGVPLMTSIASVLHWRMAFLGLAGLALLIAPAVWLMLARPGAPSLSVEVPRGTVAAYSPLLRHPPSLGLVGATLLGLMAAWSVLTYVAAFYVEAHGLGVRDVGWIYMIAGLALMLGTLLAGWHLGRLPPRPRVIVSRAASGVLLGLVLMPSLTVPQSVALLAIGVFLVGVSGAATAALLADETPAGRATALALNGSAMNLGTALGASLGGPALVTGGYPALGWCALTCALAAAGVVWWTRPRPAPLPPPAEPASA